MTKPRHPAYSRTETSKGPGGEDAEVAAAEVEAEERGGKQGGEAIDLSTSEGEKKSMSATRPDRVGRRQTEEE